MKDIIFIKLNEREGTGAKKINILLDEIVGIREWNISGSEILTKHIGSICVYESEEEIIKKIEKGISDEI